MANSLPPLTYSDLKDFPYTVQEYLRQIRNLVAGTIGAISWTSVSKTGSNLTDLVARNHDDLQNISGGTSGQYYHLTSAQHPGAATLLVLTSKSVAGSADVTLSTTEAQCRILKLTGIITGNINVIVPTAVWQWTVNNATSGAFTLTVKTTAGTGIVVGTGKNATLYCDGTNVVRATADV